MQVNAKLEEKDKALQNVSNFFSNFSSNSNLVVNNCKIITAKKLVNTYNWYKLNILFKRILFKSHRYNMINNIMVNNFFGTEICSPCSWSNSMTELKKKRSSTQLRHDILYAQKRRDESRGPYKELIAPSWYALVLYLHSKTKSMDLVILLWRRQKQIIHKSMQNQLQKLIYQYESF